MAERKSLRCPRDRSSYARIPRRYGAGRARLAGQPVRSAALQGDQLKRISINWITCRVGKAKRAHRQGCPLQGRNRDGGHASLCPFYRATKRSVARRVSETATADAMSDLYLGHGHVLRAHDHGNPPLEITG